MIHRKIFAALLLAMSAVAGPSLTTVQDVLYKADGTRFSGTLTIRWSSFQSSDRSSVSTQSTTVKVVNGNLHVQLVPTYGSVPPALYSVTYNSDGRVQFQETWAVPSSTQPVRLRDVRVSGGSVTDNDTTGGGATTGPVTEADVIGLTDDLAVRPVMGPAFATGRVAFLNDQGQVDGVTGNPGDCLHVDGTSGPCGGDSTSFVDGDAPAGIVDGGNTLFTLSALPVPAGSLAVYRNGLRQKIGQDYTLNGQTLQFAAASTPQPGDTILASYRLTGDQSSGAQVFPSAQVLCSGTGASTTTAVMSSIGQCTIGAGVLLPGDRLEVHLDLEHQGTASGFSFEVLWGSTTLSHRDGAPADTLVTAKLDAAMLPASTQLSFQSWGSLLPFVPGVASAADAYANGLTINIQGKLGVATGDTLSLRNFTIVRLP